MITKIGAAIIAQPEDGNSGVNRALLYGTSGGLGAALMSNALTSGDVTGRETLYHGTDAASADAIRRNGLKVTTDDTAVNTKVLKDADPERYNKALGKAYMTPSADEAMGYAQGKNLRSGNFFAGEGVVKANVPTWKMRMVANPEVDMPYKEFRQILSGQSQKLQEMQKPFVDAVLYPVYRSLRKARTFEQDVPTEYIRGASNYRGNSLGEIVDYARHNKLRFAKGLGKFTAGAGLTGAGAYGAYRALRQEDATSA